MLFKLFKKSSPQFYSDWSPLKKAWMGLWKTPATDSNSALELNKEFLDQFYNDPKIKSLIEKQKADRKNGQPPV